MTDYRPTLSPETRDDLTALAAALGFYLDGRPSVPQMLEALAAASRADPGGTRLALRVLLDANGLLPERPQLDNPAADSPAP